MRKIGFMLPLLPMLSAVSAQATPMTGFAFAPVPPSLVTYNDGKGKGAVAVTRVVAGSPAALAGIKPGDVVISANGAPVTPKNIATTIQKNPVGSILSFGVIRSGMPMKIDVTTIDSASFRPAAIVEPLVLVSGIPVDGDIRASEFGQRPGLRCFVINTRPGDRFVVAALQDGYSGFYYNLSISVFDGCKENVSIEEDKNMIFESSEIIGSFMRKLDFIAGGGQYTVILSDSGDINFKKYRIQATYVGKSSVESLPSRRTAEVKLAQTLRAIAMQEETTMLTASTVARISPQRAAGSVFRDCPLGCPEMVVIPAGRFMMGSPASEEDRQSNEGPRHQVTIGRAFAMGKTEITADEWDACVAEGGCPGARLGLGRRPATGMSWVAARGYAEWLSKKTGELYFLPSEAEWEYAARAGTETPWNTGDAIITDDANISDIFKQAVPVAGFPANAFGLHDMHGNVAEWTLDCIDVGYFGVPNDGKANVTPKCPHRAVRGGSWANPPSEVRSARRMLGTPSAMAPSLGFRVTRAL